MLLYEGAEDGEEGGIFTYCDVGDATFRVNNELGRETLYTVLIGEVGGFRIVDLKPWKLMSCH